MARKLDLHITGEAVIKRADKYGFPTYTITLSNLIDGNWEYKDMQITFPKGTELKDETRVRINDAFFTFYITKDNQKFDKIIVRSFDIMNEAAGEIDIPTSIESTDSSDLPW